MTSFARHYSSVGFRLWRHRADTRRPLIKVMRTTGFFYLGIGPVAIWRDGRRIGMEIR